MATDTGLRGQRLDRSLGGAGGFTVTMLTALAGN